MAPSVDLAIYVAILGIAVSLGLYAHQLMVSRRARRLLEHFTSGEKWIAALEQLHRENSHLRIVSRTPGLLLPTEQSESQSHREYFAMMWGRLEGPGSYQLDYLVDLDGLRSTLANYRATAHEDLIAESRKLVTRAERAVQTGRLRIRTRKFESHVVSRVIGSTKEFGMGYRPETGQHTSEWVIVRNAQMTMIVANEFDQLFRLGERDEVGSAARVEPFTLATFDAIVGTLPPVPSTAEGAG